MTDTAKITLTTAESLSCKIGQIAKPIVFQGSNTRPLYLLLTDENQQLT